MGSQPRNPDLPFENCDLFVPGNDFGIQPYCQSSRKTVGKRNITGRFEKRRLPGGFPIRIQNTVCHAADVLDVLVSRGRRYGLGDVLPNNDQTDYTT